MKPLPLLLAISLVANAALAVILISHRRPASAPVEPVVEKKPTLSPEEIARAASTEALIAAAKSGDALKMRDQLRALGLPDEVIRAAVRALIWKPVVELQRGISSQQNKNGGAYWRAPVGAVAYSTLTKEQRTQLRDAQREASKLTEELLGSDPNDPFASRLSFLPADKAAKMRDMERDYSDMRAQISAEAEGFSLPSDSEKFSYLEKEQRKDLEALLTPEELKAYDMRNSNTANRLRYQLRDFDASEAEYNAIYAAQKAFDDRFSNAGQYAAGPGAMVSQMTAGQLNPNSPNAQAQARNDALQQMYAQLKAELGDDRFQAYLRSQNQEYRNLEAAAKRFNLPTAAVDQVYSAREQTVAAAQRIANDSNLTDEQRQQALTELANQTRATVQSTLGNDVASAYLKSNMRWLDGLSQGQPITVTPDGNVFTRPVRRPVSSPPVLPPPSAPRG